MAAEELTARARGEGFNRLSLLLGLGLGAVAAVLIAVILTNAADDKTERTVPATRVAVVAAQDIQVNTRLTANMLKVSSFKIEDVDADAFTTASQLTNRVTASAVVAGQVILPSMVSTTAGVGLTFTLSPGMRAMSIGVKEVVTAGGNVTPGNFVDIVGVFQVSKAGDAAPLIAQLTGEPVGPLFAPEGSTVTFTLLQNVRVLAVAQNLPNEPKASTSSDGGTTAAPTEDTNPKASTVTLEVTPQQAQILAVADLHGTLRLSLRPFGEEGRAPVNPIIVLVD